MSFWSEGIVPLGARGGGISRPLYLVPGKSQRLKVPLSLRVPAIISRDSKVTNVFI